MVKLSNSCFSKIYSFIIICCVRLYACKLKHNRTQHPRFLPPLTESLQRLHQLDGELFPFGQLLQHLGDLVVPAANQAVAVDRLDHVPHVDDLDLVDDAAFPDSLESHESFSAP